MCEYCTTLLKHMEHKPSHQRSVKQFIKAPDFCAIRSVKQSQKFKLWYLVTWRSKQIAISDLGQDSWKYDSFQKYVSNDLHLEFGSFPARMFYE